MFKVLGVLPRGCSVQQARAALSGQLGRLLTVTSGDSVSVEVTDSLATKGEAFSPLCLAEGFSSSEVVVVDDSYNDVDMSVSSVIVWQWLMRCRSSSNLRSWLCPVVTMMEWRKPFGIFGVMFLARSWSKFRGSRWRDQSLCMPGTDPAQVAGCRK